MFPYGDDPNSELFRKITSLALVKLNPADEPDCCVCSRCVALLEEFSKWQEQTVEYNLLLVEARGGKTKAPEKEDIELLVELNQPKLEKQDSEDDVDPFLAAIDSDSGSEHDTNKRPQRRSVRPARFSSGASPPKRGTKGRKAAKQVKDELEEDETTIVATPLTVKINKGRKATKVVPSESELEFEEDAVDSDASFKPSPPNRRRSKPAGTALNKSSSAKRRKIKKGQDDSLHHGGSLTVHNATDFQVFNAGHGTVNISFRGFRYFKYRHYRSRSAGEVHYGWQCIEHDCSAQIYTRSVIKGSIFWKNRFMKHNHSEENYEKLVAVKIGSMAAEEQHQYSEDLPEREVLQAGRRRHCYSLEKLPSGEEILLYGDHKHHQLVEKVSDLRERSSLQFFVDLWFEPILTTQKVC